jgi:hypothetical protein
MLVTIIPRGMFRMLTISVGQALLILMDKYGTSTELKTLYLNGGTNRLTRARIRDLMQHVALSEYQISYDPSVIDTDPSRRYFETHLAYETLNDTLPKLWLSDLLSHAHSLGEMMRKVCNDYELDSMNCILRGEQPREGYREYREYSDYISRLISKKYFTDDCYESENKASEIRTKIKLLVSIAFLGIEITQRMEISFFMTVKEVELKKQMCVFMRII